MAKFCCLRPTASEEAYGSVAYLRLVNDRGETHCSLIFGKSRLVRNKPLTIPRLELCAAVVAAQTDSVICKELRIPEIETNSVFGQTMQPFYAISITRPIFPNIVANREQKIKNVCSPSQWHHVPSNENPADLPTRGLSIEEFL